MSIRILTLGSAVVLTAAWSGPRPTAPAARATSFVAHMTAGQETPPNNTSATGTATFSISGTTLHYSIDVKGLSEAPTAAHVHVGAKGVAGPPVFTFPLKAGVGKSGTISEGTLDLTRDASAGVSGDSLRTLLGNGHAYVNVHTKNFPGGEIRGQVMPKA